MTNDKLLERALGIVEEEFGKEMDNPQINNPAAYALYKAWRFADSNGKAEGKEK